MAIAGHQRCPGRPPLSHLRLRGRADAGADGTREALPTGDQDERSLGAYAGGFLSFFAVGCPVCNKLVLLALGYTGALTWFQPLQPVLQLLGFGLLAWALRRRLSAAQYCPVPVAAP
ncbi:MAG: hypothetical protein WB473_17890 [Pedococcus sp.]